MRVKVKVKVAIRWLVLELFQSLSISSSFSSAKSPAVSYRGVEESDRVLVECEQVGRRALGGRGVRKKSTGKQDMILLLQYCDLISYSHSIHPPYRLPQHNINLDHRTDAPPG
jgi:hypothetical protein